MAKSNEEYEKVIAQAAEEANLGQKFFGKQQYDQAIEKFKSAIGIFEGISREYTEIDQTINIARCHIKIGEAFRHKGEYDNGLAECNKALKLQAKVLDPNHLELVVTYNKLAVLHLHKNEISDAKDYCKKTFEILKNNNLAEDHPLAGAYHMTYGGIHKHEKNYDLAIKSCNKALEIYCKLHNNQPIYNYEIYFCYFNLAYVMEGKGEYKESIDILTHTISLSCKQYGAGTENPMLVELYNKLSRVYQKDGQEDKSEECKKKIAELKGKHVPLATEQQSSEKPSADTEQQVSQENPKADSLSEAISGQGQGADNSENSNTDTLIKQLKGLVINGDSASAIQEDPTVDAAGVATEPEE